MTVVMLSVRLLLLSISLGLCVVVAHMACTIWFVLDKLVLNVVAQVILNVCEKLTAQSVLARLVGQSKVTQLVERGFAQEFDHVHTRDNVLFL